MSLQIGKSIIGEGNPTYIIAEISANHAGTIDTAKEIIKEAKAAGVNCVKIQTYTADTLTLNIKNEYFNIQEGKWKGYNLYELYKQAYTPWEWQQELKMECEKLGLDFLSTAYDFTSVDFLESISLGFYKIASFELNDIPLLKYVAEKQKPIILSTGMATLAEIDEAIQTIRAAGNNKICLLKCTSSYPGIPEEMNLRTIPHMKNTFQCPIGLSDHSMGHLTAIIAVSLGAAVIEKHICLDRSIDTPDSSFSMEPHEFKAMVDEIRKTERILGKINYGPVPSEQPSLAFRKSIFVSKDIKAGEKITVDNVKVVRPSNGLHPRYYFDILGKKARIPLPAGTPLNYFLLEE